MSEQNFLDKFHRTWTALKFYLYIKFIEILRWVGQPGKTSKHKFHQKIAIFGDDFALGFGDKIRLGAPIGLSHYLIGEMARDKKIKQFWSVYNLGTFGSTTRDWLPNSETTSVPNHPHLLENWLLENDRVIGCKIVGLMIGFNDHKASPPINKDTTIENIKIITKHLVSLGYKVYLFTIPPPTPPVANGRAAPLPDLSIDSDHTERSRLIRELIERGEIKDLHLAVEIDASNYEYRRRNLYGPDSPYFNELGYTKITRDWFQIVVSDLIKQEFSAFCGELGIQT